MRDSHSTSVSPPRRALHGYFKQRLLTFFATTAVTGGALLAYPPTASAASGARNFESGAVNVPFTVPAGVTEITVRAVGARGMSHGGLEPLWRTEPPKGGAEYKTVFGGYGAVLTGVRISVTPGQVLYVNVPHQNTGGASDIRTSPTAQLTGSQVTDPRLIVAAGGGEAGRPTTTNSAGDIDGADGGNAGSAGYDRDGDSGFWPRFYFTSADILQIGAQGGLAGTDHSGGRGGRNDRYPRIFLHEFNGQNGSPGTGGTGGLELVSSSTPFISNAFSPQTGGRGGDGWFGGGGGGASDFAGASGGGGAGSNFAVSAANVSNDTTVSGPSVTIDY